jgi:hypothetical protein
MAAQETYRIEPKTRYALTELSATSSLRDLAIFGRREAAEKALLLAYKAAELGQQLTVVPVKRYLLQLVTTTSCTSNEESDPRENYRTLAEFPRLDDAEKARIAFSALHQAELNKTAKIEPLSINQIAALANIYSQN